MTMTHQTSIIPGHHPQDVQKLLASSSAKLSDVDTFREVAARRALLAAATGSHVMNPGCSSAVGNALLASAGNFYRTAAPNHLGGRAFLNNNFAAAQQAAAMKQYSNSFGSQMMGGGNAMNSVILEAAIRRLEMERRIQMLQRQNLALNGGNPLLLQRALDQRQQQQLQLQMLSRAGQNPGMGSDSTSSKQAPQEEATTTAEAVPQSPTTATSSTQDSKPRIRGGVTEPFPEKLHRMLVELEESGEGSDIISFFPHGKAFVIHDPTRFANEVMPKYFNKQSRLSSFQRQLNLYGFMRIKSGPDFGGYYHELFVKGRPDLSVKMRRVAAGSKSTSCNGSSSESQKNNNNKNELSTSLSASEKAKESAT